MKLLSHNCPSFPDEFYTKFYGGTEYVCLKLWTKYRNKGVIKFLKAFIPAAKYGQNKNETEFHLFRETRKSRKLERCSIQGGHQIRLYTSILERWETTHGTFLFHWRFFLNFSRIPLRFHNSYNHFVFNFFFCINIVYVDVVTYYIRYSNFEFYSRFSIVGASRIHISHGETRIKKNWYR